MNAVEGMLEKNLKIKSDQLKLCFRLFRVKARKNDSRDINDVKDYVIARMNPYLETHDG